MEIDLVELAGIPFEGIPAAGLHGVGLRAMPGNIAQLSRGYFQARDILSRFQPDALFFTGGFIAVPMAFAGKKLPALLFVPDIEPGLALKTIARYATRIAVTVDESVNYFPRHSGVRVTGYPVRPDLMRWDENQARAVFGLSGEIPTLLVFGGSKGARSINRALLPVLPELLEEIQVIHISGSLDWKEVNRASMSLNEEQKARYRAFPYLHEEMGAALRQADLVLSRAGASTLGEFTSFGLPAILVPYPHAWRYQYTNAEYLAKRGAAVLINDSDLPKKFLPTVRELIQNRETLVKMSKAMFTLAKPDAASQIAQILLDMSTRSERKRM